MREQVQEQAAEPSARAPAAPALAPVAHDELLQLQRAIGNRAMARRILARKKGSAAATPAGSRLVGLKTKLTWDDFKGKPGGGTTAKGHPIRAQTKVDGSVSFAGGAANQIGPSAFDKAGGSYSLKDSVVVTVKLDGKNSWKKLAGLNDVQKQLLLDHEQGHYDIAALVSRDMFLELMAEKGKSYSAGKDAMLAVAAIIKRHQALMKTINDLYDSPAETGHEAWTTGDKKPSAQTKWEGYFTKARTEHRQPEVQAPDGTYYKVTLESVLKGAGFTL